jgi:uncharacterized protein
MTFDCHTHWGSCWQEESRDDLDAWWRIPESYGVTHALLMPNDGLMRQDAVHEENAAICRLAAHSAGRIIALVTAVVQDEKSALREIEECVGGGGARGLKFHPWLQGFSLFSPTFRSVCRLAGALDVPIVLHDGTPVYSLTEQATALAALHPETRFVLGHSGLLWNYQSVGAAALLDNCYATLCGPHAAGLGWIIRTMPKERILWGSDYGFGSSDPIGYRLALLGELGLSDSEREMILAENPQRLIGDGGS